MEGRERADFFASEWGGEIKNASSSTPSPASTPSPPLARGFTSIGGEAGTVGGDVGSGIAMAAAAAAASRMEGIVMATGMMGSVGSGFSGGSDELARKKRGRPRKFGAEGMALALMPRPSSPFSSGSDFSGKRGRGRPRGSGKRQLLASLGEWFQLSAGGSFTPHVVTIAAGEDVAARILSFSQKGPRAVCILSANGAISNVTLRQPGSSGGTLTYEGRFELLSLSGSFTIIDYDGVRSRTGGLSVSLAGPDGRVIGGGVAGLLLAASPIQVVVGSFIPNAFKERRPRIISDSSPFTPLLPAACVTEAIPTSPATQDDECETAKPTMQGIISDTVHNNLNNPDLNPQSFEAVRWQGLQPPSEQRPSPDINICLVGKHQI